MAGFSDLSNELVLQILHLVPPRDLVSACLITKGIYLLAEEILKEHRQFTQQFSFLSFVGPDVRPLAKLLVDVLAHPVAGHYVRSLRLDCWYIWLDEPELEFMFLDYKSHDLENSTTAIKNSEIFDTDEENGWLQAIQDGFHDAILALLLLHLPNLDSLEIRPLGGPIEYIPRISQRIQSAPVGTYFSHLKHVSVSFQGDWKRGDAMRCFIFFMKLPSLVSSYTSDLGIGDEELEQYLRPHESNVTHLDFSQCRIGTNAFHDVLRSTRNLRSFSYTGWAPLDWYGLSIGLLHHARHSLEKLTLHRNGGTSTTLLYSLREFEVLQEIDTELSLFYENAESSVESFPGKLPASVQILCLRSPFEPLMFPIEVCEKMAQLREATLNLLSATDVQLPQLNEIHIVTAHDARKEIF